MFRILAIGDITSPKAAAALTDRLWSIRQEHHIDFTVINAENAGFIIGPSPDIARELLRAGADVLTGGNHLLQNNALHALLEEDLPILRPANYPDAAPGFGYTITTVYGYRILTVNALGRVHMEPPLDSPFAAVEKILQKEKGNYDLSILDFHAEATGEKLAMAMHFDGRFTAIFGTHTHVPTADIQILPCGTGYVTDLGMCGAKGGILGISKESVLPRYLSALPSRFAPAEGDLYADAVIFTANENSGKTEKIERIKIAL